MNNLLLAFSFTLRVLAILVVVALPFTYLLTFENAALAVWMVGIAGISWGLGMILFQFGKQK